MGSMPVPPQLQNTMSKSRQYLPQLVHWGPGMGHPTKSPHKWSRAVLLPHNVVLATRSLQLLPDCARVGLEGHVQRSFAGAVLAIHIGLLLEHGLTRDASECGIHPKGARGSPRICRGGQRLRRSGEQVRQTGHQHEEGALGTGVRGSWDQLQKAESACSPPARGNEPNH